MGFVKRHVAATAAIHVITNSLPSYGKSLKKEKQPSNRKPLKLNQSLCQIQSRSRSLNQVQRKFQLHGNAAKLLVCQHFVLGFVLLLVLWQDKETESTLVQNTIVSSMDVFFIPTSLRLCLSKNIMHQIQNLNQETVPVEWALVVMMVRLVATVCVKQAVDPNRCRIDQETPIHQYIKLDFQKYSKYLKGVTVKVL